MTRLRAGQPKDHGSITNKGRRYFFSPNSPDQLWDPQFPIQLLPWDIPPELRRPEREYNHFLPPSADDKFEWRYTSAWTYYFMAFICKTLPQNFKLGNFRLCPEDVGLFVVFVSFSVSHFPYTALNKAWQFAPGISCNVLTFSSHSAFMCFLCVSQNKSRLFPYTPLTDRFL